MRRYIDADEFKDWLLKNSITEEEIWESRCICNWVDAQPTADVVPMEVVPMEVIEQIKWERDTAVEQLKELGYGLGEKVNKYDSKLWIPCDKELPKNDDWKIITIHDDSGDNPYIYTDFGWYLEAGGYWIVHDEPRRDVVAWMVLPNPYNYKKREKVICVGGQFYCDPEKCQYNPRLCDKSIRRPWKENKDEAD